MRTPSAVELQLIGEAERIGHALSQGGRMVPVLVAFDDAAQPASMVASTEPLRSSREEAAPHLEQTQPARLELLRSLPRGASVEG